MQSTHPMDSILERPAIGDKKTRPGGSWRCCRLCDHRRMRASPARMPVRSCLTPVRGSIAYSNCTAARSGAQRSGGRRLSLPDHYLRGHPLSHSTGSYPLPLAHATTYPETRMMPIAGRSLSSYLIPDKNGSKGLVSISAGCLKIDFSGEGVSKSNWDVQVDLPDCSV